MTVQWSPLQDSGTSIWRRHSWEQENAPASSTVQQALSYFTTTLLSKNRTYIRYKNMNQAMKRSVIHHLFIDLAAFLRLPIERKLLYLEALGYLTLAWFLVQQVPFRYWSSWLGKRTEVLMVYPDLAPPEAKQIAYTICRINQTFGNRLTCLMQAMAGKFMLKKRNIQSSLVLGLKPENTGSQGLKLNAHAWLQVGDRILIGGEGHHQFKPISSFWS